MKKTYILPAVLVTSVEAERMIAVSGEGFNKQIGTEGVDGGDLLIKGTSDNDNYWDFDWNE